jgi:uncharacterized protein (TIGR02996 family)
LRLRSWHDHAMATAKKVATKKPAAKKPAAKKPAAKKPAAKKPAATKQPAASKPSPNPASDRQAQFLADILANIDDKKPRLVYADLLQDLGDPRGELIALSCARADLPDGDARIPELDGQIEALLKKHKKTWTAACGENKGARYEYRRGFVEKLSLDAKDLLANADKIFAAEPIEELNVWKIDESPTKRGKSRLAPLLELPLHHIRRLSLARCKLVKDDFEALAAATTLGSVELLDLTNGGSYEIPVAPLAKATSLPKLRELNLRGCMIGDDGIEALAASTTLKMQKLILARNDLHAAAGAAIAAAPWAPGLVHLDVSSNEMFGDGGLRALADSTQLTSLRTLILEFTGLYDAAVEIFKAPLFQQLERIDISATGVDIEAVRPFLGERVVWKRGV